MITRPSGPNVPAGSVLELEMSQINLESIFEGLGLTLSVRSVIHDGRVEESNEFGS